MIPADLHRDKTMLFHFWSVSRIWGENNVGQCLLIPKCFCAVYDYAGKADLSCWNLKRKLGVTTHFSEIIKIQYFSKV